MENDICLFALKSTLDEVQKICPDIKNTFMFNESGKIIAADGNTPEETIIDTINALHKILEKADPIGGVEAIFLDGDKNRLNVSHINDLYLITVTPKKTDWNYVNTVTHIFIPTVLRLLEKIDPASLKWG